jgi:hypothetical protein
MNHFDINILCIAVILNIRQNQYYKYYWFCLHLILQQDKNHDKANQITYNSTSDIDKHSTVCASS